MERKKRILMCGEASYLCTGYAVYTHELLTRLYKTGKYEIAELASSGNARDNRIHTVPWKFFPVEPDPTNQEDLIRFNDRLTNQFGEWKFEDTCIDFKPDIVIDIRDWYMFEFQERSAFRNYYNWAILPTVDSAPQDDQWIATFSNADAVFTYTDWGRDVLEKQGGNTIKLRGTAPPAANSENFQPVSNKDSHKESMGISAEVLIIGTVMRNQPRKLYPDLFQSFSNYLKKAPPELAKRTFLYVHAAYPDLSWRFPTLLKEFGISHKVLFTYICKNCGFAFPSFFQDACGTCRNCNQNTAVLPKTRFGVDSKILGQIMNLFDVYIQYANSEGFGMPQVEAAYCGIPVFAVDYSGMSDILRKVEGTPINVLKLEMESDTHCYRAIPDNEDLVNKLIEFFNQPNAVRQRKGFLSRELAVKHFNWDKTAKIWEEYFDEVPLSNGWDSPPRIHNPAENIPPGLTNEEFSVWAIKNIIGRSELCNSYMATRLVRDLNWGEIKNDFSVLTYYNDYASLGLKSTIQTFNQAEAARRLCNLCLIYNYWENKRYEKQP
jgi:glycosyltransferase involved in cell wall biosynthesis